MQTLISADAHTKQPALIKHHKPRPLDVLAKEIKHFHSATIEALEQSVRFAILAGDNLLQAKQQVAQHGQWTGWVQRHCEMSERTAQLYMQLARNRQAVEAKMATVADLTLNGAVRAIASPKAKPQCVADLTTTPLPKLAQPATATAASKPKRCTKHELMAVWLSTPADERLQFMNDVGLVWRRDAEACTPPSPPHAANGSRFSNVPDTDLFIPEFLKVV
jgi:hypothetical protein